jgi:ParB family chromosome partitioning protein
MAKGKAALGRGLGALLPDRQEDQQTARPISIEHTRLYDFKDRPRAGSVSEIEIELIAANPYQPRTAFDEEALNELATSIRALGIIQPVTVRAVAEGRFELISGERRLRASKLAGLTTIPAYVREADTEAMLEMAIVENVQREELNPVEVALGYQRLIEECDLTQDQVSQKVGKSRAAVANMLRLLKLPAGVQAVLRDGRISVGHARALIPVEDADQQRLLVEDIIRDGLSVRAIEERVKQLAASAPEPAPAPRPVSATPQRDEIVLRSLTDRLRSGLGTKVAIKPKTSGDGGRIEIDYYSDEDLERIIDVIGG